jgi:hypothetical protein
MNSQNIFFNTCAGTLLVIWNMSTQDIVSTFVLGAIGAAGAYLMTILIKWVIKQLNKLIE